MTGNPPTIKKSSLMDLALSRAKLIDQIVEAGGEMTPAQEAELVAGLDSLEAKVEAVLAVIDSVQAQQEYAKEQARMASNWAGSCGNLVENLRKRIAVAMKVCDCEKLKAGFRTVSRTISEPKLIIENQDLLPDRFVQTVFETVERVTVLKDVVLADLREGKAVEGAKMSEPEDGILATKARDKKEKGTTENV